jgi:dihydroflavonol-4-reductase
MAGRTKLVIGASGFLGSHVTRQLVQRGDEVRVLIRKTSSTKAIEDLDVDRHYGEIFDDQALRSAMEGCDDVFYCVVDARAWLRDPAPLFRTNVEGLRHVLDAAVDADLRRFVFTSTIGTIAIGEDGPVAENAPFNWLDRGGAYIRSRVEAENLVLSYYKDRGLPAVALCVANTYGPGDYQPTPHGSLVAAAAAGKMPFYVKGMADEVVGIEACARQCISTENAGSPRVRNRSTGSVQRHVWPHRANTGSPLRVWGRARQRNHSSGNAGHSEAGRDDGTVHGDAPG